jgi:hypothetical protein
MLHGNRRYDNGRSINEGVESILKNLDSGAVVSVGIDCGQWYNVTFSNYDQENNLAFFDLPPSYRQYSSLTNKATKITYISTEID